MPNITPEALNEITGKLIDAKDKRERYLYYIESLKNGNIKYVKMDIEFISKFRRSNGMISMNFEEILIVLENRLKEANTSIEFFDKKFNELL